MKLRTQYRCLCLAICWVMCAGTFAGGAEYAGLLGRHVSKRQAGIHARLAADLVILGRSDVDSNDLLFEDATFTNVLLNTNELEFEKLPTGRYDVVLTDDSDYELQFTFLGFPDGREARARRTATDIQSLVFFAGDSPGPFDDPDTPTDTYGVVYLSNMGSIEVNLRRRVSPNWTFLHGFRYIGLQEDLYVVESETVNLSERKRIFSGDFIEADNALYGYQLGVEGTLWSRGRLKFVVEGRGGVFANRMDLNYRTTFIGTGPGGADEEKILDFGEDKAVFAGEFRASLVVPLGGGSLRVGYQLLGIEQAVLAPDQLDNFSSFLEIGALDFGQPIYQGGFVGLEVPF